MVLKWMWLSTEHPVIANSFTLYLRACWGEQFGDSISVQDADAHAVLCQAALRCGCAEGAQRQDLSAQGRGLEKRRRRDKVCPGPWRTGWISPVGNVKHKAEAQETRMRLARRLVLQEHTVPGGRAMEVKLQLGNRLLYQGSDIYVTRVFKTFFLCLFEKANYSSNIWKVF